MSSTRPRATAYTLAALQLLIGLSAVGAGVALVLRPSGELLGMPVSLLERSPFSDYLVPGLVLLLVNGVGSLVAAVGSLRRRDFASPLGVLIGTFLVGWIAAQVHWMGATSWLQPTVAAIGLVQVWLALALGRPQRLGPDGQSGEHAPTP